MGINVLLFVVVQVGLEPRRRKRLVRGFEDKVKEFVMQIPQQTGTGPQAQQDTPDIAIEEAKEDEETGIEDTLNDEVEMENRGLEEIVDKASYISVQQDIWISAAAGAVAGGLITALGTWLISR